MLKLRVFTAAVLIGVFVICDFLLAPPAFSILSLLIVMACAWEWSNLCRIDSLIARVTYIIATVLLLGITAFFTGLLPGLLLQEEILKSVLIATCIWWCLALLWVQGYPTSAILWGSRWIQMIVGWWVLIPCWIGLAYIQQLVYGPWVILLALLIVVCADTGAYAIGSKWGKHKLAPNVSPGKSWEGFIGGVLCTLVLAGLLTLTDSDTDFTVALLLIVPAALASTLGDLLESMMKRHRGIKDSGRILPGHGGMLDRIDSLTASVPILALAILSTGWAT